MPASTAWARARRRYDSRAIMRLHRRHAREGRPAVTGFDRALVALGLTGLGFGIHSISMIASSSHLPHPWVPLIAVPVTGWSYTLAGLVAWRRRPDNAFGALMTLAGFAWLSAGFAASSDPVAFSVGYILMMYPFSITVHVVLAYPSGRTRGVGRIIAAAGYVSGTLLIIDQFFGPRVTDLLRSDLTGCTTVRTEGCPRNVLTVWPDATVVDALIDAFAVVWSATLLASAVLLAVRLVRQRRRWQRGWAPISICAIAGFVALAAANTVGFPPEPGYAFFVALPLLFLLGLRRGVFARAFGPRDLPASLASADPSPENTRRVLSEALGDPSLDIEYWLPGRHRYVRADGSPAESSVRGDDVVMTPVTYRGRPIARLTHKAWLSQESGTLEGVVAIAAMKLDHDRLQAALRAAVKELRASRERIVTAADEERQRLARDLHDGVQQQLVVMELEAGEAILAASAEGSKDLVATIERLRDAAHEAVADLRELSRGIDPPLLAQEGLSAAVEALARRSRVPVSVNVCPDRFARSVERAAYFVTAEALTNAAKYAAATNAEVEIRREDGSLVVRIADDGVGGAGPQTGSGLSGLADRVAALGGTLEIDSPPGHGTAVTVSLPATDSPESD